MITYYIQDTANDITVMETISGFHVRYGLQVTKCRDIKQALKEYNNCLRHALQCCGLFD